ncbi:MAG: glutamate--tRNA ligase [Alphaproteobacteria bacterium]|nr:glutamate--tRNA ligase [Alphaproteobacteria bacterium]
MSVFVRFAPSPTGRLHIGNIRAALFNFLFARKAGGRFLLRMDDTDLKRSTAEFAQGIERDLRWLGIVWDDYFHQSNREARYHEVLETLKKTGRAYPCFETPEELTLKRKTQLARGLPPVYDRAALRLSQKDIEDLLAKGLKPHWRFLLKDGEVIWDDLIQKKKTFPTASLSDPVIVREDGVPLYTFSSVIDDADKAITHIIRGEDHVTNTAVQIQLWQAITENPVPAFAHYPLLVNASGEEMSKRLGTLSIAGLRDEMHIEAMAITSMLARLGTSDPIIPMAEMDELINAFDLSKISRATPKFDVEELKSLNAKILHLMPFDKVQGRLNASITADFWQAVRPNISTLEDVKLWWQVTREPLAPRLEDMDFCKQAALLLPPEPWDETTWQVWTLAVKNETGRKGKDLFMPLRLALTGMDHGPELKALLPLIGRSRALKRLEGQTA